MNDPQPVPSLSDLSRLAQEALDKGAQDESLRLYQEIASRAAATQEATPEERAVFVQAYVSLGLHAKSRNQVAAAIRYFDHVLKWDPRQDVACLQRGILRSRQRQDFLALEDLTQAIELHCESARYHRAIVHLHRDQAKDALMDLEIYLSRHDKDPWAWYHHGLALSKLNDFPMAIGSMDRALVLDPDLVEAYAQRGVWQYRLGNPESARDDFDAALKLGPSFTAYFHRGLLNQRERRQPEAIEDFTKALTLQDARPEARQARGVSLNAVGQYARAIQDLNLAFFGNAKDAITYSQRGLANFRLGHWPKALDDLNQSIKMDSQIANSWLRRGQVYLEMKEYAPAAVDLLRGVELSPQEAEGHTELGRLWMIQHQWDKAIAASTRALELNPISTTALLVRAKSHLRSGLTEAALKDYCRVLEIQPGNTLASLQRGMIHYRAGRIHEALEDFRNAVVNSPEADIGYHQLALTLMQLQRYSEASEAITKALQAKPNNPTYIRRRGQIALRTQQPIAALEDFRRALALAPNDSAAYRDMGLALEKLGQRDEALAALEKALQLSPKDAMILSHWKRLQGGEGEGSTGSLVQGDGITDFSTYMQPSYNQDGESEIELLRSGDATQSAANSNSSVEDSDEWTQSWPAIR